MKNPPNMNQPAQTAQKSPAFFSLARIAQIRNGWVIAFISWTFSVLMTALLLLGMHYGAHGNFSFYSRINHHALLLNALIFFTAFLMLHAVTNRWWLSGALLSLVSLFIAIFHIVKLKTLDIPLLPADVMRLGEFMKKIPHLLDGRLGALLTLVLLAIMALPVCYWALRRRWLRASRRYRLLALACGAVLAFGIFTFEKRLKDPSEAERKIKWIDWSQKENYERNGFFVAFTTNFQFLRNPVEAPGGYSAEKIEALYRKYLTPPAAAATTATQASFIPPFPPLDATSATLTAAAATSATLTGPPAEPVNVVLYLADSFWDVSRLGLQLTADPIPFFHRLQQSALAGEVRTPAFGGFPAKTEFEILTGISLDYLPEMTNPYSGYLDLSRPLPTLPRLFNEQHYRTLAIHPYAREMWDRAKAYPELGFEEFNDADAFKTPRFAGPFISDESVVDKIIEVCSQPDPCFIFGVTLSTQGPYDAYHEATPGPLDVTTPLSPPAHDVLRTYINALARADAALKRMIEHFSHEKKKTLVVILGNHMPLLGDDMSVYRETRYLKRTDVLGDKMLQTPIVIWANYKIPRLNISRDTHQLLPLIVRLAGLPDGNYEKFIESTAQASAREHKNAPSQIVDDIQLLQYDLLFGRQYALQLENASPDQALRGAVTSQTAGRGPAFVIKSYGPAMAISGEPFNTQPDGSSAFWFMTDPVTTATKATLNGLELSTIINTDRTMISAILNKGHHLAPDTYRIYLYDQASGRKSNEVTFKVYPPGSTIPGLTGIAKPTPTPDPNQPVIKKWGPQTVAEGATFNLQSNGNSALWFNLERTVPRPVVIFNGTPLETFAGSDGSVSAGVPKNLLTKAGDYPIVIKDNATSKTSAAVLFRVYPPGGPPPAAATPPGAAPAPDPSQPAVKSWGPQATTAGTDFNAQAGGNSAIWFVLEQPAPQVTVLFGGTPLATFVGKDGAVSATVPKNLYAKSGDYPIVIKDNPTGKLSAPLHFVVSDRKP